MYSSHGTVSFLYSLKGTDWGDLDILVLDLPPGTGDVQLQVLQDLQLSGAVAVTTPSKLAAVDTRKGVEMFTSLGVPTLSVVENMAYFQCEGGEKHYPFGQSLLRGAKSDNDDRFGNASVVQLPISMAANAANDNGEPLCLRRPDDAGEELRAFEALAKFVSREILKIHFGWNVSEEGQVLVNFDSTPKDEYDIDTIQLSLDKSGDGSFLVRLYGETGAVQKRVSAADLRSRDPKSGDVIEDSPFRNQIDTAAAPSDPIITVHKARSQKKKSPSLQPTGVERKGLYGFAVRWGDGATIIYSKKCIAVAAGGRIISHD